MKRLVLCALALFLAAPGCADLDVVPTWALTNLDTRIQPDGNILTLDDARNWRILTGALGAEVRRESRELPPPAAIDTWTEFWRTTFKRMASGQEHPEKYFGYVVEMRRSLELPDLPKGVVEL